MYNHDHGEGQAHRAVGGLLLCVEPHGSCRQGPQAVEEAATLLPGPLTLGVRAPILLPQWKCSPSPTPCSSGDFSGPWRGEPLHPPSRDLPTSWQSWNWSPSNRQPSHACPGPKLVFSCPCLSGEANCPGTHPLVGRAQVPTESLFHCPILFLWFLSEGEKCKKCTKREGQCLLSEVGQLCESLCSSAKEKQKLYCKLSNLQDTELRPGILAGADSSGHTKSPCLPPSHLSQKHVTATPLPKLLIRYMV